jgi:hypothetical protein
MRVPVVFSPTEIINWPLAEHVDLKWRPCRNCGFSGEGKPLLLRWDYMKMRTRIAWRVFTGRYDAVNWGETSGELAGDRRRYIDCTNPAFFRADRVYEPE